MTSRAPSEGSVSSATVDLTEIETIAGARTDRRWRRLVVVAVAALVLLGIAGVLGARSGTVTDVGGGYELTVTYPEMSRAGLPANWELRLKRVDGAELPSEVRIASVPGYFGIFDQNGFSPAPSEEWQDSSLVWVYAPPEGATELVVSLDARLQPDIHRGRSGRTAVVTDGVEVVSVDYHTGIAP
jgi:hypothetical protein